MLLLLINTVKKYCNSNLPEQSVTMQYTAVSSSSKTGTLNTAAWISRRPRCWHDILLVNILWRSELRIKSAHLVHCDYCLFYCSQSKPRVNFPSQFVLVEVKFTKVTQQKYRIYFSVCLTQPQTRSLKFEKKARLERILPHGVSFLGLHCRTGYYNIRHSPTVWWFRFGKIFFPVLNYVRIKA